MDKGERLLRAGHLLEFKFTPPTEFFATVRASWKKNDYSVRVREM